MRIADESGAITDSEINTLAMALGDLGKAVVRAHAKVDEAEAHYESAHHALGRAIQARIDEAAREGRREALVEVMNEMLKNHTITPDGTFTPTTEAVKP